MPRYTVYNPHSGQDMGTYEADSEAAAVLACVKDAGYDSIADMEEVAGPCQLRAGVFADDEEEPEEQCKHKWSYTGTAYGGDDERFHGEGRAYCCICGADGDS